MRSLLVPACVCRACVSVSHVMRACACTRHTKRFECQPWRDNCEGPHVSERRRWRRRGEGGIGRTRRRGLACLETVVLVRGGVESLHVCVRVILCLRRVRARACRTRARLVCFDRHKRVIAYLLCILAVLILLFLLFLVFVFEHACWLIVLLVRPNCACACLLGLCALVRMNSRALCRGEVWRLQNDNYERRTNRSDRQQTKKQTKAVFWGV